MNAKKIIIARLIIIFLVLYHPCSWSVIVRKSKEALGTKLGPIEFAYGGYIKNEGYWDSRQVVGFADDQTLAFPEKQKLDTCGNDINAHGEYDMVPVETNMYASFKGVEVGKAALSGYLSVDFFGKINNPNIPGLYLAYMTLDWENLSFKSGQWWHPFFVLECYPNTVSNNSGGPIAPSSRNPQIQVKKTCGNLDIIAAAMTQLIFTSDGPFENVPSQAYSGFHTIYLRNSMVPILNAQLQWHFGEHIAGIGADFKRIVPRLETNEGFKAHESLNSLCGIAYATLSLEKINIRLFGCYSENGTDYSLMSGYAVKTIDWVTDNRTYTNISALSWWFDIESKDPKVRPGLFCGLSTNLGSKDCIVGDLVDNKGTVIERRIYGLDPSINTVFRVAPRVRWLMTERLVCAAELEYTYASYGEINRHAQVVNTTGVGNTRLLLAMYFYM